jgi:hypothetical protein
MSSASVAATIDLQIKHNKQDVVVANIKKGYLNQPKETICTKSITFYNLRIRFLP